MSVVLAGLSLPAASSQAVNSTSQLISTGPAGGNGAFYSDFSGVPDSATRALFWTKESLTGADSDGSIDLYERSGASTALVSTGPSGGNGAFAISYGKTDSAGDRVFFASNEQLTADDNDAFLDVYERSGGVTTLMSKGAIGGNGSHDAYFAGASADGSRVWFETAEPLESSDTDSFRDVYQRHAGNTSLLSTGPDGGNGSNMTEWVGASSDGAKVYMHTDESLVAADTDVIQDVYERSGATTSLVSTGPTTSVDPDTRAVFRFVSADGSRVLFNTREALTATDTDTGSDIFERSGGTTTLISVGNQSPTPNVTASFAFASQDGTKVFFESTEKLDAADTDAFIDVYLRSGDTTTQVSAGGGNQVGSQAITVGGSDDGSKLFFRSEEPLDPADTDASDDIYRWQAGTKTLLSVGTQDIEAHPATNSADGDDVFFYTYESLVAGDTDAAVDLYQHTGGGLHLISTGTTGGNGAFDVVYSGSTPDAKRVFFRTREALTAGDTDSSDDLYSADVGGQIDVVLANTPQDPQDFTFTIGGGLSLGLGGGSTFDLDDDADGTLSDTRSFTGVAPGTGYSVSQAVPAGWDQTSAACSNGSSPAAVNVAPGETVTCTFTNRKRGRIVVVEDSIPDDAQDFSYTAGGGLSPTGFVLDDDADGTNPNTISFDDLTPGAGYSVSQATATGWALTGLVCSDGSPVSNIDVSPGETVTCTFTNRKRGSLVVIKDAQPNDPQDFAFTGGGGLVPSSFSLDDDSDGTLANTRTFNNLSNGATYSLSETLPPGWGQASATCSNGSPVNAISVPFNTTVTCTFTNANVAQIVVVEDSTPDDPQDFSFTAGGGLSPSSFSLDDDSDGTLSNTRTFSNVVVGSGYSLSETVPSGWDQTSATCSDGSPVSNVNVSAGETVTCTFANRKRGQIVAVKDAVPNDAQDFSFSAGGGLSPTSFSLDDDADGTLSNSQTFADVVPGAGYTLSETVPGGWDQTSATCSDGSPASNIDVAPGEIVTCTWVNTKRATLTVTKDAVPNDPQDFSFTAGGGLSPASFSLDDDSNGTLSNSQTFTNVPPGGGYSVSEAVPAGWDQASATCDDGSAVTNIGLSAAENVTCTFTNNKRGTIVVVKDAQPNDAQDFSFTAGGGLSPGSFSLDDDSDGTLSNTQTITNVAVGSGYSVSETVPSGWDLTTATCSDGSPVSNISVGPNETVTCTFTNRKRGQVNVVKDSTPDDPQDFAFTAGGGLSPTSFSLDDDSDGTLPNTQTFANVVPASGYSLSETVPGGWDQTSATCDDGSPVSNVSVSAGETVTCTFANRKRGQIVVVEDSQPDDAQDFSYTAAGGLSPSSFSLDDDANATLSNTRSFANLVPGSGYSVTQGANPSGWNLSSATCDNGNSPSSITVSAAQTVTCTFTNKKQGSIVVLQDTQPNDPEDFSFTAGGGLSPATFQLDDHSNPSLPNTQTFSNVPAQGGYSIVQTAVTAWPLTSAVCNNGNSPSAITVAPNQTVTCTFVNQPAATLTIAKNAVPDDAQNFDFAAGSPLTPTSFQLDDDTNGALSNARQFLSLVPGTYNVGETSVPAGWDLASATCSDGSPVTAIVLSANENTTCTFTNNKRGSLVAVKDAQPDDPQDFSFTGGGGLSPSSFSLDDDSEPTLSNTRTFSDIPTGALATYSLTESVPSAWAQTAATCSDGDSPSAIGITPGATVTCTFTNKLRGQISIVKNSTPDDPQDFSFTAGGGLSPSSFSLDDDADGTLSNTRVFTGLVPQSGYSASEAVPGGWDQTSATCSDGSPVSNIDVGSGESVTCTFNNRKRGRIIVVKDSTPDDPQDFAFTAGGGLSPTSFSLDDDANGTLSNTQTYNNVVPGSGYSLSETVPSGWDQTSATCSDGSPVSNVNVAPDETVTCTFSNRKRGQIVAVKDAVPNDPQDFSFTAGGGLSPTSFSLDDDSNGTLSNTQTYTSVVPGAGYALSETLPTGWDQTSATCDDGSPVSNIDLSAGETVTCTFANRKRGQIVAVKDAVPNDPQDFSFSAGGGLSPTSFSLDDDADGTLSNSQTFANVVPGAGYTLSETVPTGWDQTSATCSDGSPASNIDLAAGENVTCTFTNNKRGTIVVVKDAQPNDAQDFSFTTGGGLSPASFSLDDDSDGTLSNTQTITGVPVGSGYSVSESVPAGWDQTAATCSDGSPVSNIAVSEGETVTCTFTNRKRGQINVVKDSTPDDAQDFSFTAGGGLSPTSFSLDDDVDGTLSNTQTYNNVVPGSGYALSETVPTGWDQTSATCSDGSPVSNIDVGSGESVTCTFNNRKRARLIVVQDSTPNDPQDFAFTASTQAGSLNFSLDDDSDGTLASSRTFSNLTPGSAVSVSQTVPTGWDQTSATCDDGSPVSNIDVSEGETVTCTFSNRKRGQIVAVKDAVPNDPQDFSFSAGGGLSPTSFSLDDDADGTLSNSQTFANVVPGAGYTLSETVPTGWDQTSATCSDGSPASNIDVSPGETITCTWVNTKRATLTVIKDALPNDPQDFAFTAAVPGDGSLNFSLDDDSDGTLANSRTFANLAPLNGYTVTETVPTGWDQTSATCSDGSPASNIDLAAGENVTCTFTNNKRGTIVVVKDATPDDPQDFSFTTGGGLSPASFSLDDDANPVLSNTQTITGVPVGSGYSVSESVPTGWDLTSATCDDGSPVSNIDVGPDETVTCTFNNRKRGQVNVVKDATPDDPQDFSFTAGGGLSPTSFALDDDADGTLSNTRSFANVVPGAGYSLSETVPGGWDQTSATCDDGSPLSNVSVSAGETVTCTFANAKRGQIVVVKDATPNDAQDFSFTAGGGLSPASFDLDDDANPTLSNTRTFATVLPGSGYSLSETVPSGWDQTSATCDDGSPVSNIDVSEGETVTCTFSNRKRGQIVAVKDAVPNDPQDFSFSAGGGLSPTSFSLDDDADGTLSNSQTFANVVPGAGYTLSETVPSGWDQTSATCSDGSSLSNIDVSPGETITCTWVNTKRATLTVVKDALPNDPQDFAFTAAVPGDGSLNFSLDDDSDGTLANSRTFANLAPLNGYTVTETVPSGWDQSSATCDDGSAVTSIGLSPGENVTCTFTNRKRGTIVVVKDATPDDPQDFSFTTGGGLSPGSFSLDDDANPVLSNTQTITGVPVGSGYSVSESVPTGWDLTSATCDDGSPVSSIDVGPDETVTCTFNNRKRGQVDVVKDATPDDAQDFSFSAGGGLSPTSFALDDDADGTLSNTRSFANVFPGAGYSLSETVPGGWDQTSATCDDGSPLSNVSVSAGETVTCTFANAKRGQIVVVKDATPNDAQDFSFSAGGGLSPASFDLDDDANPTLSNTRTFATVLPGSGYSLSETVPSGWDQTSATCDDGSPVSNIDVSEGETVTCTFSNRKRGQIVAVKDAVPNDPQDFSFSAGGGLSPTSFSLDDDADGTLSNSQTFANVVPGAGYTLSETVPSGWDQTSATCSDGSSLSNIDVSPGETITCTWVNTKRATLTVVKDALPNDPQDFAFTAAVPGDGSLNFSLDDDSDGTLANSRTFANLAPLNGYTVTETVPSGWDQSSATCDDGSAVTSIGLSPGENVTCTFTNRKRGTIVVVKDATPDDPQDFSFTTGGGLSPGSFSLDDDANPVLSNTQTITGVPVGSGYSVSESVPTGWDLTSATCDDGSPVSSIDVGPDETVTCTFNNRKRGQVDVVKDATPDDAQDFSFSAGGGLSPTSFALDDDADGTLSNTRSFANVFPGAGYSLSETVPGGWDQTSATCDDGSPLSNVSVSAGETVTCTFANAKRGQIVVVKDATPNDAQDFSFTAGGGLSPASFDLDDDANPTLSNTRTFATVLPGSGYSLSETVPSGWDQTSATCDDGSPVSNIDVSEGETVTCTFSNRKRGQIVAVKDAVPNDPQDFSFSAGGGLSPTSFSLDDDADGTLSNSQTFANVVPGAGYTLSETVPSGWTLAGATCDDGSLVSSIDVGPGETVTCTWTNHRQGQLVIVTDSQPDDPQDFSFTTGGGLSPASFSLDDDADGTLSNSRTFANVVPGAGYTVSETPPAGWDLASATCDDGSPTFNISVSPGEAVTCTFTNVKRGQLVVVKDAQPTDPQDFSFTTGGGLSPASFSLDDDADGTLSNTRTFSDVAPGAYSLSEQPAAGWMQESAACDDGSSPAAIGISAGETVTCTFTNTKKGQLVVIKDAQPNDAQDFAFTAGGGLSPASFNLDDDSDGTLSNTRTFANIDPGSYSLAETVPGGWDQTSATCSDGSPASNVSVAAGETVTCTFTNRKRGQIVVVKDAQPNDPQDFTFTAGGGLSPASFDLDDDADGTLSNTRTFADVVPGSGYSLSETLPTNWSQSDASCSDGSPVGNIDLGAGETVTCTFTNVRGYPRPKAATPTNIAFVHAYDPCGTSNRQHASPLSFGSCNPPARSSSYLTSGTPDANSRTASFFGNVVLKAISGDSGTPADEADVSVKVHVEDVRLSASVNTDYTGELGLTLPLQMTDRHNGPSGTEIGTVQGATVVVPVPCTAVSGGNIGATCDVNTTVDAVLPGAVTELKRSIWELGQLVLMDGGADGAVSTNDNTVFARQGVFVP